MNKLCVFIAVLLVVSAVNASDDGKNKKDHRSEKAKKAHHKPLPCTCAIFLSGQLKKGSKDPPKGEPVLTQELEAHFANNKFGQRQCVSRCLEAIVKHLPRSADIICATADRDCYKEKAYLFTRNHGSSWMNSNMSAGREFCCKDNLPYKCPLL